MMAAAPLSVALFTLVFLLVEAEKVDRNQATVAGAVLMLLLGWWLDFYALQGALQAIYFDTLALIFGMSLIVNMLARSGLFSLLATKVAAYSRGNVQ
ncbi:MAG: SLC13 family permease, partial [Pseudomonadota bacterium]